MMHSDEYDEDDDEEEGVMVKEGVSREANIAMNGER